MLTVLPAEGFYPAVGMHSDGEEVRLNLDAQWHHSDVTLMSIDTCEEDWSSLHDVRINGQVVICSIEHRCSLYCTVILT